MRGLSSRGEGDGARWGGVPAGHGGSPGRHTTRDLHVVKGKLIGWLRRVHRLLLSVSRSGRDGYRSRRAGSAFGGGAVLEGGRRVKARPPPSVCRKPEFLWRNFCRLLVERGRLSCLGRACMVLALGFHSTLPPDTASAVAGITAEIS